MAEKFDMLIQSLGISIKVVTASDYDALAAELAGKRDNLDWVTCERDELRTKVAALEAALRDVVAYFGARNVHPMVQRLAALLPITVETACEHEMRVPTINKPPYSVDPKSMELAQHFLSNLEGDEASEDMEWDLANVIQQAVEGWFVDGSPPKIRTAP